jgi:hypothetical protein
VTSGDVGAFALRLVERGEQVRRMPMIASANGRAAGDAERLHPRYSIDARGQAAQHPHSAH